MRMLMGALRRFCDFCIFKFLRRSVDRKHFIRFLVWTKNIWCVFRVKPPFSNSSRVVWMGLYINILVFLSRMYFVECSTHLVGEHWLHSRSLNFCEVILIYIHTPSWASVKGVIQYQYKISLTRRRSKACLRVPSLKNVRERLRI